MNRPKLKHLDVDLEGINRFVQIVRFMRIATQGEDSDLTRRQQRNCLTVMGWKPTEIELIMAKIQNGGGNESEQKESTSGEQQVPDASNP